MGGAEEAVGAVVFSFGVVAGGAEAVEVGVGGGAAVGDGVAVFVFDPVAVGAPAAEDPVEGGWGGRGSGRCAVRF